DHVEAVVGVSMGDEHRVELRHRYRQFGERARSGVAPDPRLPMFDEVAGAGAASHRIAAGRAENGQTHPHLPIMGPDALSPSRHLRVGSGPGRGSEWVARARTHT